MRDGLQERKNWTSARRIAAGASLALSMALSGCASGYSLKQAEGDDDLITGSIPAAASAEDPSDETTIRNAVSSADIASLDGKPLAWANRDTGATGSIDTIEEYAGAGRVCRSFTASRENYQGVHLFAGTACLDNGVWSMTSFKAL